LHEYKARGAHIEVAKELASRGEEIEVGDEIKYVIVKGKGRHSDKAIHFSDARKSQIDVDYYCKKQIIPVVLRILEIFGVKQSDLN